MPASTEGHGCSNAVILLRRSSTASGGSASRRALYFQSTYRPAIQHQPKQKLHTSTTKKLSTTTCDFTHSSPAPSVLFKSGLASAASGGGDRIERPNMKALRTLFVASAIPMVGFGFMDNLVMIQAGQYIDSTLGVSLGLATMTAAAAGQVVSDVSGVIFGGSLERLLMRMSLIRTPQLTSAQRQLPICRNTAMAGAVCGVVVGCALGALTLLLVDLEARNRIERAQQLREIVTDMITDYASETSDSDSADTGLSSETCTVYVASSQDFHLEDEDDEKWRTTMKPLKESESELVHECAAKREATLSGRRDFLCVPISDGEDLLAVIEFRHNHLAAASPSSTSPAAATSGSANESGTFSENDVRTAKVMARHIAIFMNRIVE